MIIRLLLIAALLISASAVWAQDDSRLRESSVFSVNILQPQTDGANVGCEMAIRGVADIPSGYFVWVLVHRIKGFQDVWWPQNIGEVDPQTKNWAADVTFGEKSDISYEFEIAAIVVNQQEHNKLKDYRRQALKSRDWRPIDMPPTEIAPAIRKIIKVSHDECRE